MSELHERHRRVIPNWVALYYDEPLELVSGSGSRVTDATGRTYLDFFCGILTNMLGYDVPEVREAIQRQIGTGVVHTSTLYLIRNQVELAEKLARLSGIGPLVRGHRHHRERCVEEFATCSVQRALSAWNGPAPARLRQPG